MTHTLVDFDTFLTSLNEEPYDDIQYTFDIESLIFLKDTCGLTKFMTAPVVIHNNKNIQAVSRIATDLDNVVEGFKEYANNGKEIFIYQVLKFQTLEDGILSPYKWIIRYGLGEK